MPRRNLLTILAVVLVSLVCYQRVDRNPYGRYLARVLREIDHEALERIPPDQLFDGAMNGIVEQLDEYSSYITRADTEEFEAELEQQFGGVGVMIRQENANGDRDGPKQLVVVNPPLIGTPAARAGIAAGNRIVAIDGKPTASMTMKQVIALMRGRPGDPVTLSIVGAEGEQPREATLIREIIKVPSVLGDLPLADGTWDFRLAEDPSIGYIRVTSFGEKTAAELQSALADMTAQGARALILDLRDNAGGLLDAAVATCELLIDANRPIVSIKGRGGRPVQSYHAAGDGAYRDLPIAVLVNRNTASASEIVAACLQDHGRAIVIGERTWGKGTVQHVIPIEAGRSRLKLTAASYWRPSGRNIHRGRDAKPEDDWGVSPDDGFRITLPPGAAPRLVFDRARRDVVPGGEPSAPAYLGRPPEPSPEIEGANEATLDPQLQAAVGYLQRMLAATPSEPR